MIRPACRGSLTWQICRRQPSALPLHGAAWINDVACGPMPTAPRLGRRHSSDAVCQGVAGPHGYADGLRKPTVANGVYVDRPTTVLCRRVPSAYLCVARRPLYADGQNQAVGITPEKPTGAVGIVLAVGVWPCSGSACVKLVVLDIVCLALRQTHACISS